MAQNMRVKITFGSLTWPRAVINRCAKLNWCFHATFLWFKISESNVCENFPKMSSTLNPRLNDAAVTNFQRYLRINTVQPNPDYDGAVNFLTEMSKQLNLPFKVVEVAKGKPVFVMTWLGTDPSLPSILLNSHMDVVPVFPEHWKYEPFAAVKDENGDIFARGTQDMKSVGIQYIEAIRRLQLQKFSPLRTVHISFVPDEEIGGTLGMALYVQTPEFKALNVGFALDEGLASPTDTFIVYNGERCPWWVKFTATGDPGHGLQLIGNTAAEKILKVMNKFMELRESQKKRLEEDASLTLGSVTSINMTILGGGVQVNVIPSEMTAFFDIRIPPKQEELDKMDKTLVDWAKEAGPGVTFEAQQYWKCASVTETKDSNPWWLAFSKACTHLNLKTRVDTFPGATDSRFLRQLGIPAIGFSPMNNTPILLHDHNEFLNESIFVRGIDIYTEVISRVANVAKI